ncbi:MAG: hypothetical protein H6980_12310 [Gammaproteobacteria bacterium]|nr:hypothetical protein [Gammaproteobacteria bacterium]
MSESTESHHHAPSSDRHRSHRHRSGRRPHSRSDGQAAAVMLLARRGLGIALLLFAVWGLIDFPVATLPLLAGLAAYVALLWWRPSTWLLVLPVLVAGLDLTPYSGRLLWTGFDNFVLATIAMGLWHKEPWRFTADFGAGGKRLFALLIAVQALFTLRGALPLRARGLRGLSEFLQRLTRRQGFPVRTAVAAIAAAGARAQRFPALLLAAGLLAGLAVALVSVLWERLGFTGFLDLWSGYRLTGLFAAMHDGGASLHAFVAMSAGFLPALFLYWRDTRLQRALPMLGVLLTLGALYFVVVAPTSAERLVLIGMVTILLTGFWLLRRATRRQPDARRCPGRPGSCWACSA